MQLLRSITDHDVQGGPPEYIRKVSRYAARGILLNEDNQVAMMEMSALGLFKLPGGGLEGAEEKEAAFVREIR
ncbi:NUDIX domain-containing protein [Cohnella sp. GCM10027633]|uniref:NUDIX domain-containing protein n=1 Tax=unclassified Cohnella TaxID=2636738 RepID=UPI00362737AB